MSSGKQKKLLADKKIYEPKLETSPNDKDINIG